MKKLSQNTYQQGDKNKELSIARICKHNPKSFCSYINERRIVKDNIGPLKTVDGGFKSRYNAFCWPSCSFLFCL